MGRTSEMVDVTVSLADDLVPAARPRRLAVRSLMVSFAVMVIGSTALLWTSAVRHRLAFGVISGVLVFAGFAIWTRYYVRLRQGEKTVCRVAPIPKTFMTDARHAHLAKSAPMAAWFLSGRLVRGHKGELLLRYGDNVYRLHEVAHRLVVIVNPARRIIGLRLVNDGGFADVFARGSLNDLGAEQTKPT